MLKLKVCGINDNNNLREISGLHPDFIGLNFYSKSKRFVKDQLDVSGSDNVNYVGVFVNPDIEEIIERGEAFNLKYIQLHGDESPGFCEKVKEKGFKIIKAFRIDSEFDFKSLREYDPYVDIFLFDAKGKDFGGNGVAFNWRLLDNYELTTPFLLAGGLSSDNIQDAISIDHQAFLGLDINSGYELSPGKKDAGKVKELINTIR